MTLQRTELKRGTKPLARKTPIQRKKVMPTANLERELGHVNSNRLPVTGAVKAAPKKKPKPKKPTKTQWKKMCDDLFSLIVRSKGPCVAQGWRPPVTEEALEELLSDLLGNPDTTLGELAKHLEQATSYGCLGSTQCAHIVSRGYMGTRWDESNATVLCAGDHVYFTHQPEIWRLWVDLNFGVGYYHSTLRRALGFVARQEKPDYPTTLARLVARAEELQLEIPLEKFKKHLPILP